MDINSFLGESKRKSGVGGGTGGSGGKREVGGGNGDEGRAWHPCANPTEAECILLPRWVV